MTNLNLTEKQLKTISWILTILSIIANILVIEKCVLGMVIWTVSSIGFVIYTRIKKEPALMWLYIVYTILNISGIIMWSK